MTVIKKIVHQLLFFFLMFFFPLSVYGLDASLSVHISGEWVKVEIQAYSFENDKILTSLEEGLTAQIFFQFRVYHRNGGFLSLFGDRLILEKRLSYIAFKDFFLNQYVIQINDEPASYYDTVDDFFLNFLLLIDERLIEAQRVNSEDNYVLARVSINPVKLEPPLHIISLFSSIGRTSGWIESSFDESERDNH